MPRRLKIYDFDGTISDKFTFRKTDLFSHKTNTKADLELVHNDEELCAIATYHDKPDYVLSYLLPLLKRKVIRQEIEINNEEHYQLTKVYLEGCQYPLIIATPIPENYNTHLNAIGASGKNTLLNAITKELPPCSEYDFYDDQKTIYDHTVGTLKHFNCHLVNGNNSTFDIIESQTASTTLLEGLIIKLRAYLYDRTSQNVQNTQEIAPPDNEKEKGKPIYTSSRQVFFAKHPSFRTEDYKLQSEHEQVVNELINFLSNQGPEIESTQLEDLVTSDLKPLIDEWQVKYERNFLDFMVELKKQRALLKLTEEEGYNSDDEAQQNYP